MRSSMSAASTVKSSPASLSSSRRRGEDEARMSMTALRVSVERFFKQAGVPRRILLPPRILLHRELSVKLFLATAATMVLMSSVAQAQQPPIIDRQLFFGEVQIASAQISPDGQWISF